MEGSDIQCTRQLRICSCRTSKNPRTTSFTSARLRSLHSSEAWPPAVAPIPDDQSFKSSKRSLAQPSSASVETDKQELMRASQLTVDVRMSSDSIETMSQAISGTDQKMLDSVGFSVAMQRPSCDGLEIFSRRIHNKVDVPCRPLLLGVHDMQSSPDQAPTDHDNLLPAFSIRTSPRKQTQPGIQLWDIISTSRSRNSLWTRINSTP